MGTFLPVALFALAGALVGGARSLHRQGAGRGAVGLTVVLAVLAVAGGVLWLLPGGDR
ncbi:hypothetical protein ACN27F_30470 [Solwaraspora sp. WMMB335]|uniref:hypothetical protein n=1 Tax=Solwaraspora sp. WMMB335 TaxID=3404118 RepID=UPI003B93DD66